MKEEIAKIAEELFRNYPEIIDPTILKDSQIIDLLKKKGIEAVIDEKDIILIKIYWANIIFWKKE